MRKKIPIFILVFLLVASIGFVSGEEFGKMSSCPCKLESDVNGDCKVNLLDMIGIRNNLNGDNLNYDVNRDGKINLLDMIKVRNDFNKVCPEGGGGEDENLGYKIVSKADGKYIVRDGVEYKLFVAGASLFPTSVCENEKIDITVEVIGTKKVGCASLMAYACISIWESDTGWDDSVTPTYCQPCVTYDGVHCKIKHTFKDVDLTPFIEEDPGSYGEFYFRIKDDKQNCLVPIESEPQDVKVDYNCDCLSGPCCDTSSRPYKYKSSGTKCGTCKTCNSIGSCSRTPSDDSACGRIDCSSWYSKTGTKSATSTQTCWNKKDITSSRCEGFGNCKDPNSADCNSQRNDAVQYSCGICKYIADGDCSGTKRGGCSNFQEGTWCGLGKHCDGNGNCVPDCECTSGPCCDGCHYYKPSDNHKCSDADSCSGDDLCTYYICDGTGAGSSACTIKAGCSDCGNKDCNWKNYYFITGDNSAKGTSYCTYRDYVDCNRPCFSASCQDCSCTSSSDLTRAIAEKCEYISGCSGSTSGTVKNYPAGTQILPAESALAQIAI